MSNQCSTIWEDWGGIENGTATYSPNHDSKGAVISFLHHHVGGLVLTVPGYRRVPIEPRPGGGITWARTHHDAPRNPHAFLVTTDLRRVPLCVVADGWPGRVRR